MGGFMQVRTPTHMFFDILMVPNALPQPQGHVQVLLNILRGFTAQSALDAPRFCISAGLPDAEVKSAASAGDVNAEVFFEDAISDSTVEGLLSKPLRLSVLRD
jgi:hypothetical protein